jgi:predicted dehydrogenase
VQTALQPIRLAIIGCGAIVEKVRLPTLAGSSDFEVIAVVDPIRERAEALAGGQDVAGIFEDIESLPGTIEAALIATPNQLHATQAVQLLERGIHVCVEKPLAPHASDCERMIEAAEQHGRILMTALDRRYRPQYRRIHRTIANHALGQIQRIIVREGSVHDWPSVSGFYTELGAAGGGVLLDAGIHSLDQLLWWFGEPVSLSYADDACGGPEAECRLELGFSSGTSAQLEFSRLRNLGAVTEIRAEAGTLRLSPWSAKIEFMASPGWPETLPQDVEDPEGNTVGLGGASNLWSAAMAREPHCPDPGGTRGPLLHATAVQWMRTGCSGAACWSPAAAASSAAASWKSCALSMARKCSFSPGFHREPRGLRALARGCFWETYRMLSPCAPRLRAAIWSFIQAGPATWCMLTMPPMPYCSQRWLKWPQVNLSWFRVHNP